MILRSREGPGRVFKDVQLQRAKEFFFYFFFFLGIVFKNLPPTLSSQSKILIWKHGMASLIWGIWKEMKQMNLRNRKKLRKRTYGCQGDGMVREFGMDMYTLLCSECMTTRVLLDSTGNSAQLCGSLDGRAVWGRMDKCICMTGSLCCSPETVTALLISCTPMQNRKFKDNNKD